MNKNRNIFIMIGIVALASGQLYGLSPRQLAKLRKFETELKERFNRGPRSKREADAWLEKNREIIGKIKRLDPPTAAEYQRRQNALAVKIKPEAIELEPMEIPTLEELPAWLEAFEPAWFEAIEEESG